VSKKRLVLIFPPMTMPTSPPLGIAVLKAYLGHTLPEWEVAVLDLNLWLFHWLIDGVANGRIGLSTDLQRELGADGPMLTAAAALFSGDDLPGFYERAERYDRAGDIFLRLTEAFGKVLAEECAQWERTGGASPLVEAMVAQVDGLAPDVVGISVLMTAQLPAAAMLGRHQRERRGRRVLIGGGCFTTENSRHFLRQYPLAADAVVTGAGEEPLEVFLKGHEPARMPCASFLVDGRIRQTLCSQEHKNVVWDQAPDFGGFDLDGYFSPERVAPLLLARGCYWRKCAFCVHHVSGGNVYRPAKVPLAIESMRRLVATGIRNFSLVDEMIPPGRFLELAQAIREARLDIAYYAMVRPEPGFSRIIFREMAASGCKYLLWGVESGSQRVLDLMNKGTRVETISRVLRDAHTAGIANHVFIMCGFPTETAEEWAATLSFLAEHRQAIQAVHRGVFLLEEGAEVHNYPERFQIEDVRALRDTPLGPRLGYRCRSGMDGQEVVARFQAALPFLRIFHPHARYLANFRDHALLYYQRAAQRQTACAGPGR